MSTDSANERATVLGEQAIVHLTNGTRFRADQYAFLTDTVLAVLGDWDRDVELIGMPTTNLLIPLTSVAHMQVFDFDGEATEESTEVIA